MCSKKRGLEIRPSIQEPLPSLKLTRTGCEERGIATGLQPIARITCHALVHALAAFDSENWPELVFAVSKGDRIVIPPSAITRSGR